MGNRRTHTQAGAWAWLAGITAHVLTVSLVTAGPLLALLGPRR